MQTSIVYLELQKRDLTENQTCVQSRAHPLMNVGRIIENLFKTLNLLCVSRKQQSIWYIFRHEIYA